MMLQDEPLDLEAIERRRLERKAARGVQKKPQESGFKGNIVKNYVTDAWDAVKGIGEMVFIGLPVGAKQIATNPKLYWEDLKSIASPEVRDAMIHEVGGRYFDRGFQGFAEEVHNRPFTAMLDMTVVGGLIGKTAQTAGKLSKAPRLVKAGAAIAKASQNLDPLVHGSKLIGKVARPAMDAFGMGEHTKPLLTLKQNEYLAEAVEKQNNLLKVLKEGLTDPEAVQLDRAISVGSPDDIAKLTPSAKKSYEAWREISAEGQEAVVTSRRLVSEQRAHLANAKRAAAYLFPEGATRENVRIASQLMKEGKINPTFASMYKIGEQHADLFTTLTQDIRSIGKVGRLEKRTARGMFEKDPRVYMVRQVNAFHEFNKRLRWLDRTMQYLKAKGLIKAIPPGGDVPKGYAFLQDGVFKKYYEDAARAGSVQIAEIMRGVPPEQAAVIAYEKLISDPTVRSAVVHANAIAVPRHVATLIAREFKLPGAIGRVYDRGLGYWKAFATIFNPRYWLPVALGNGFLSLLYGIGPREFLRARRLREILPAPIRSRLQADIAVPGMNVIERTANKFSEFSSGLDNFFRQPFFAKGVEESRRKLMQAGADFFAFGESAEEFLRKTALAPEQLSKIERELQIAQESAALKVPQLHALTKKYQKAMDDVAKMEANVAAKSMLPDLKRRKISRAQGELFEARQVAYDLETKLKQAKADVLDRLNQVGELQRQIPEIRNYAAVADDAVELGNKFFGSYANLHPIERTFLRRLIPFYAFTKAMTLLAFRLPWIMPKRMFMWHHMSQILQDVMDDEEMPPDLKAYTPTAVFQDGSILMVRLMSSFPFAGIRPLPVGETTVPRLADIAAQQPLIKLYLELKGGTPEWTKKPLSPGEYATRIDNGTAYKYENGAFRKTIPQPSFWRSLWYLFPQSQMIEEVLQPYVQTDRGWLGHPEPIRDPKGNIMYPKELWQGLLGLVGAPRMRTIHPEEEKKRARRQVMQVLRSFQDQLRSMDPKRRQEAIQVLQDWSNKKIRPSLAED